VCRSDAAMTDADGGYRSKTVSCGDGVTLVIQVQPRRRR